MEDEKKDQNTTGEGAGAVNTEEQKPPAQAPVVSAPPVAEKKTVQVDAEVLERLVKGYESLQDKVKDLEGAADVGRLSRIQAMRNDGKLVKNAKLSIYDGKVVLGWVTVKDDVYTDERGVIHEDQQVKLFLDNGRNEKGVQERVESEPMSYRSFARLAEKIEGEVVRESRDSNGTMTFGVRLEDGREFDLPIVFIN